MQKFVLAQSTMLIQSVSTLLGNALDSRNYPSCVFNQIKREADGVAHTLAKCASSGNFLLRCKSIRTGDAENPYCYFQHH